MEQLGSHWTYLNEILYLKIYRKSVEKIQAYLKSDKNYGLSFVNQSCASSGDSELVGCPQDGRSGRNEVIETSGKINDI
jgi:hypothetical protein